MSVRFSGRHIFNSFEDYQAARSRGEIPREGTMLAGDGKLVKLTDDDGATHRDTYLTLGQQLRKLQQDPIIQMDMFFLTTVQDIALQMEDAFRDPEQLGTQAELDTFQATVQRKIDDLTF